MIHVHITCFENRWLVTTDERRFTLARVSTANTDVLVEIIAAELSTAVDRLCIWPDEEQPPEITRNDVVLWWFDGAWFAALKSGGEQAKEAIRAAAPESFLAEAWQRTPLALGLPVAPDPRVETLLNKAHTLTPNELLRIGDDGVTRHRFRPWPLLDRFTGAVRALRRREPLPEVPLTFHHIQAVLPRTELITPTWQADRIAPAACFNDAEVQAVALASAVAHLAGPWSRAEPPLLATAQTWSERRESFLNPSSLVVTDPEVVAHPRSPLTPVTAETTIGWVSGRRLHDDQPTWIPSQLVHTRSEPPIVDEPVLTYYNLAGMAAAPTLSEAVDRGLQHVISHDAVARWWRNAAAPAPEHLPLPPLLEGIWAEAAVELDLRQLPSRFGALVVLAVVRDHDRSITALGHAATLGSTLHDQQGAMERASLEALSQHASAVDLDTPEGKIRTAASIGAGAAPGLLPYREQRDYLDTMPAVAELSDIPVRPLMVDPMIHLQAGLDVRVRDRLEDRLRHAAPGATQNTNQATEVPQAYWVDTTPPPLQDSGWHAVRVLVPGCLRLEPAAFPPPTEGLPEDMPYPGW